jgi:hypothetical protein
MSAFGGGSPLMHEPLVNNSEPFKGIKRWFRTDLHSWRTTAGLVLTGATTPAIGNNTAAQDFINWVANSATTVIAINSFVMPEEYEEREDDFNVDIVARLKGSDTTAASLSVLAYWFTPTRGSVTGDTAVTALAAAATALLDTSATNLTTTGYKKYSVDVGAVLRANSQRINPGDVVKVTIGTVAALAAANQALEIAGISYMLRCNAAAHDRTLRGNF